MEDLIKRALKYLEIPNGRIQHIGSIQDDVILGESNFNAGIGLLKEALITNKMNKAKKLWKELEDIPIDEGEYIEEDWRYFDKGTHIYDIWHWFEEEFNLSVAVDLMGIK